MFIHVDKSITKKMGDMIAQMLIRFSREISILNLFFLNQIHSNISYIKEMIRKKYIALNFGGIEPITYLILNISC